MPTLFAPAKINATLEILGRRDDGYHTVRSVMLPIALYDRIDLEPAALGGLYVDDPSLRDDNLVERALQACGFGDRFAVSLRKEIPVGGGLGGGSSDAAAILRAAMDGVLGQRDEHDWLGVARALGSDVPFFLAGTAALIEATGERVTALGALPPWWCVVVQPSAAVATADAYRRLDAARNNAGVSPSRPRSASTSLAAVDALQRADFAAFSQALGNDFHDLILAAYPAVAAAAAALREAGAEGVLLSGSGSCLFAPFEREADARAVEGRLDPSCYAKSFAVAFHHDIAWHP